MFREKTNKQKPHKQALPLPPKVETTAPIYQKWSVWIRFWFHGLKSKTVMSMAKNGKFFPFGSQYLIIMSPGI